MSPALVGFDAPSAGISSVRRKNLGGRGVEV
jgi:hypothetical protein